MAYEEPSFALVQANESYEIRYYNERIVVQTNNTSQNSGFRKLFNYISGKNSNSEKMILTHDADKPMFMYLPFQAPHWPVQTPAGTEEIHEHIPGKQRRKWCGLITHIDQHVGRVKSELKAKKMYENTFIFV